VVVRESQDSNRICKPYAVTVNLSGVWLHGGARVNARIAACFFETEICDFRQGSDRAASLSPSEYPRLALAQLDDVHSVLRPSCDTLKG
jgi:hypothetical protein